jgi:hypothetical protein
MLTPTAPGDVKSEPLAREPPFGIPPAHSLHERRIAHIRQSCAISNARMAAFHDHVN